MFLEQFGQMAELLLRLPRKACYDGSTQYEVRSRAPDIVGYLADMLSGAMAVHGFQHIRIYMLNGYIYIVDYLRIGYHSIHQLFVYGVGIGIKHTYPVQLIYLCYTPHKLRKHGLAVQIGSVSRSVLRYQRELLYAAVSQTLCLLHQFFHWNADFTAAYQRYSAVGTAIIAAVSYTKISAI